MDMFVRTLVLTTVPDSGGLSSFIYKYISNFVKFFFATVGIC